MDISLTSVPGFSSRDRADIRIILDKDLQPNVDGQGEQDNEGVQDQPVPLELFADERVSLEAAGLWMRLLVFGFERNNLRPCLLFRDEFTELCEGNGHRSRRMLRELRDSGWITQETRRVRGRYGETVIYLNHEPKSTIEDDQ